MKQFCIYGHDKLVVGVTTKKNGCRLCKRIQDRAEARRRYLRDPQKKCARTSKYHREHPEWSKRKKRESQLRRRGVGYWVEENKEAM